MKIYVIRHGLTQLNKEGKYNGIFDEDIVEEGIKQAQESSNIIKNLNIDLIICSPLLRTRHTCEIINVNSVPVIFDDRIKERDCGSLTCKELGDFYYTDYWNYYSNVDVEGLESVPHLFDRVRSFLDEIKIKYKDKNILLVTHGGVARAIYFYFNEIPKDGMIEKFGSDNCGIKEYEIYGE